MVNDSGDKLVVYMVYRDSERGSKVSMNVCNDLEAGTIQILEYDITDFSVGDWEPYYDIDLWKDSLRLYLFVQKMIQGDGETLSDLNAQPVYAWSILMNNLMPTNTIYSPVKAAVMASDPESSLSSVSISMDTTLSCTTGGNAGSRKIYLGISLTDIEFAAKITETNYTPESLKSYTWYY